MDRGGPLSTPSPAQLPELRCTMGRSTGCRGARVLAGHMSKDDLYLSGKERVQSQRGGKTYFPCWIVLDSVVDSYPRSLSTTIRPDVDRRPYPPLSPLSTTIDPETKPSLWPQGRAYPAERFSN